MIEVPKPARGLVEYLKILEIDRAAVLEHDPIGGKGIDFFRQANRTEVRVGPCRANDPGSINLCLRRKIMAFVGQPKGLI